MEVFKELDVESVEIITETINIWWNSEFIDEEYLRATVCLIYKKRTHNTARKLQTHCNTADYVQTF